MLGSEVSKNKEMREKLQMKTRKKHSLITFPLALDLCISLLALESLSLYILQTSVDDHNH